MAKLGVVVVLLIVLTAPNAVVPTHASSMFGGIGHVVILVMENKGYSQIIGDSDAPFENKLASQYALASNYYAVSHPSLPNYVAMIAGDYFNFGLKDGAPPKGGLNFTNVVDLFEARGISWKAYVQDLPSPCYLSSVGNYEVDHNPFVYFHGIQSNSTRCNKIVGLDQFSRDLAQNGLPNFSFIVPNDKYGDRWLSEFVPAIIQSASFSSMVLFIVYDEGSDNGGFVAGDYTVNGDQVVCLAVSPLVKRGFQSNHEYSHYSLLATVEAIFGIGNLGRGDSVMPPMTDLFASSNSSVLMSESSTFASIPSTDTNLLLLVGIVVLVAAFLIFTITRYMKRRRE